MSYDKDARVRHLAVINSSLFAKIAICPCFVLLIGTVIGNCMCI